MSTAWAFIQLSSFLLTNSCPPPASFSAHPRKKATLTGLRPRNPKSHSPAYQFTGLRRRRPGAPRPAGLRVGNAAAAARDPPNRQCPRVTVHGGASTQLQAGVRAQHPNGLPSSGGRCGRRLLTIALCARPRCRLSGGGTRSRAPGARQDAGSRKRLHTCHMHIAATVCHVLAPPSLGASPPGLHPWPGTRPAHERGGHLQATQHQDQVDGSRA